MEPFNITHALNGARVLTRDGREVFGLHHLGSGAHGGYPLTGFIRSKEGTFNSNTWTIEGKFHANAKEQSTSDLLTQFVGAPWYDITVVPGKYDGVTELTTDNTEETLTIYRFYDENIDRSWQGTWEERGTATQWQSPGPSPKHLKMRITAEDIKLGEGFIITETDFIIEDSRFKQIKDVSWAKTKIGTKHDGKSLIVRPKI